MVLHVASHKVAVEVASFETCAGFIKLPYSARNPICHAHEIAGDVMCADASSS